MRCIACRSPRILRFIDGFGNRRIFCKGCGRSFLEQNFIRINEQKRLQEFDLKAEVRIPSMSR
jgi:hypothetical protein